jgi:branched-chain amino acid transport system ATP-binding protein
MSNILEISGLTKHFGGLTAVSTLDLHMKQGEILALIGPNGAGKSTVFNLVAGVYAPSEGSIRFKGQVINGRKPWDLCKLGLARTFQIVKPFAPKSGLFCTRAPRPRPGRRPRRSWPPWAWPTCATGWPAA